MISLPPRLSSREPPTKESDTGRAWHLDMATWNADQGGVGAAICAWIIEAPWAHPFWHSYLLSAVHLRPTKEFGEAKVRLPGATHEVVLLALNPEKPISTKSFPYYLSPSNFMGQWIAGSDEAACRKIEETVDEILAGTLSPDTDFRREWIKRFSDSNIKPEWKGREGDTYVGIPRDPNDPLVVVGTGKTAVGIISAAAAASEKVPPKDKLN